MTLSIANEKIPLAVDNDGDIRVGGTRITLDTVIGFFKQGRNPEEIAASFDTLQLADIYSVIGYYLHHKDEVEEYLRNQEAEAAEIQKFWESRYDKTAIKERLLTRQQNNKAVG